ncbi:MAG TPA: hypothetical protein VJT81_06120 [Burkholderiales bacterium]|nr:hypothetical protein [Burkholderiales bacterium]
MRNLAIERCSTHDLARLVSGLILLGLVACTTTSAQKVNFDRCAANERSCDESLLTAGEQRHLFDLKSQQHFKDCLAGMRCNPAFLSEQEQHQVRITVSQLNFQACIRGDAACREKTLTAEQRIEVWQADRLRNFDACLGGLTRCNETMLSQTQLASVREAYAQRNFSGCMNTVGTLVGCNPDDLSSEQRDLVTRRNLAVNLFLCVSAILGCDESLLTSEQRARIAAGPSK